MFKPTLNSSKVIICHYCKGSIDTQGCGWGYYYNLDELVRVNFHSECFEIEEQVELT